MKNSFSDIRDCSEFLVRGGWSFSGKVPVKNAYPPLGVTVKFWYPPLEVAVKNGYPPPRVPEA